MTASHDFTSPADEEIHRWIMEVDPEILTSAYLKCELGMATPDEQQMVATLVQKMRDVLRGSGFDAV